MSKETEHHGYRGLLDDSARHHVLSIDEFPDTVDAICPHPQPDHEVEQERFELALREAVAALPECEQIVIKGTWLDGWTLKECADVLGVNESRACQLRIQAVARLRVKLEDWR